MFCPKCGNSNPDDGKYCRGCGTDLARVSDAMSGKITTLKPLEASKGTKKRHSVSWEGAMSKLFMGAAFLAVSIILALSNAAGGRNWWFWLLIPAFAMIGTGIAQVIRLNLARIDSAAEEETSPREISGDKSRAALSEGHQDYVAPDSTGYKTGDLVPPSVVEDTTRNLSDSESETMNLPTSPPKS